MRAGATRTLPALLLPALLMATKASGEPKPVLVPDVSQRLVRIVYSFTGAELLLFGAIVRPDRVADQRPIDIVVVVKGPAQSVLVREKERFAGIWVNADRLRYRSAPSFYAIASARPIEQIVDARTRAIYELGLDSLQLSPASNAPADEQARFQGGLVATKRRAGLYFADPHAVEITGGVLYRARLTIPARVPVGRFTAETFLIRDGHVLAAAVRPIEVQKEGMERFVTQAADKASLLYGLAAVALSVTLGWAAGYAARRW